MRFSLAKTVALALAVWLSRANAGSPETPVRFVEVGESAGLTAPHHTRTFHGPHSEVLEMFTSGGAAVAVGDFDRDGDDDLFLTDSEAGLPNHLYRNDGKMHFTDVAAEAGVAAGNTDSAIVSDALWFDYDNDGWEDLVLARFGTPVLYKNLGDGRFRDVTKQSGLNTFANSIAVIAFDYDEDGRLDLLFGNYFQPVDLTDLTTTRVLPNDLDNATNGGGLSLWRNEGGGKFRDQTKATGLDGYSGWVLDVAAGDLDNDGDLDIYAAADYGTDRMYFNEEGLRFRDVTEHAIGRDTRKGMNAELGDYDNDGWLDIYVTNITDEYMRECNMLWHNVGDGTFLDVSRETQTCDTRWGWSAKFADFDNDGWLDLFATNGMRSGDDGNYVLAIVPVITRRGVDFADLDTWPKIGTMSWSGYQRSKLFWNREGTVFEDIGKRAGVDNDRDGRGVAVADFDNDGRLDFIQTNVGQRPFLYRGVAENGANWLQLRLVAKHGPPSAIGARVRVQTGRLVQARTVDAGNGYAAQSTRQLHFGLGEAAKADRVTVTWPSRKQEEFSVRINRLTTIEEGSGEPVRTGTE
ncbi:MAG: CRTAC1 family protein [Bryobacterales bacterium]